MKFSENMCEKWNFLMKERKGAKPDGHKICVKVKFFNENEVRIILNEFSKICSKNNSDWNFLMKKEKGSEIIRVKSMNQLNFLMKWDKNYTIYRHIQVSAYEEKM